MPLHCPQKPDLRGGRLRSGRPRTALDLQALAQGDALSMQRITWPRPAAMPAITTGIEGPAAPARTGSPAECSRFSRWSRKPDCSCTLLVQAATEGDVHLPGSHADRPGPAIPSPVPGTHAARYWHRARVSDGCPRSWVRRRNDAVDSADEPSAQSVQVVPASCAAGSAGCSPEDRWVWRRLLPPPPARTSRHREEGWTDFFTVGGRPTSVDWPSGDARRTNQLTLPFYFYNTLQGRGRILPSRWCHGTIRAVFPPPLIRMSVVSSDGQAALLSCREPT